MKKSKSRNQVLPLLAFTGITKNKELFMPYFGAGIFSSFLYFTFASILSHPIMGTLPKAAYAQMMLMIGFVLLSIIVLPFLHYTYRFVIKRRKKELGLYSILGLEKKHIAVMMVYESLITTLVILAGGVLLGLVFGKLVFMLLFYMLELPVLNDFPFSFAAFRDTVIFFFISAACNLAYSLYTVGKSNPIELFADSRKGEKKPRFVWIYACGGVLILAMGYALSITSEFDGSIFANFFLAVFLVIIGTYLIFTSGSVMLLSILQKRKSFYYKPSNFITVSGMYYRMRRNAAGLVNICIFSTMVIITLTCTLSLYFGMDGVIQVQHPYDIGLVRYSGDRAANEEELRSAVQAAKESSMAESASFVSYVSRNANVYVKDGRMEDAAGRKRWEKDVYHVEFLTIEAYNRATESSETLEEGEILLYSDGRSCAKDELLIFGKAYTVKNELTEFPGTFKAEENDFNMNYWVVAKDYESLPEALRQQLSQDIFRAFSDVTGDEEARDAFAEAMLAVPRDEFRNNVENKAFMRVMYGGLLFIGVFFGLLFIICLLVIMYYKQITEGYEDRNNFEIMQKVGMSHEETRHTIAKQILLVFFFPIFGAVCHTMAALPMTVLLLCAISLFNSRLVVMSCAGVLLVFLIVYGISYLMTARAYLRIVERRG